MSFTREQHGCPAQSGGAFAYAVRERLECSMRLVFARNFGFGSRDALAPRLAESLECVVRWSVLHIEFENGRALILHEGRLHDDASAHERAVVLDADAVPECRACLLYTSPSPRDS